MNLNYFGYATDNYRIVVASCVAEPTNELKPKGKTGLNHRVLQN